VSDHDEANPPAPQARRAQGSNRRSFLRNAGLAGAGTVTLTGLNVGRASASQQAPSPTGDSSYRGGGRWNPDTESLQFTLAVMPDTQFMFWGSQNSYNPEPQAAAFSYLMGDTGPASDDNVVFMAHLGDLVEDAAASSFQEVDKLFDIVDRGGVAYSVLAGNHDVSGDDTRGNTPYLQTMGPQRFRRQPTFAGSDSSGYNTAHIFRAAGQEWLLLAMDWRTSAAGFAWANQFIKAHPTLPVILTAHEILTPTYDDTVYPYQSGDPENNAELSDYGQQVWDTLIKDNDQIFLTLNGHYWPSGRVTQQNSAGNDVYMHIANYQQQYFGGGAKIRLYRFDLVRNTIDVETFSPFLLEQEQQGNVLAALYARQTTAVDRFSIPIDFEQRFAGFAPTTPRPARPARQVIIPGTLAYWRFDQGGATGTPVTSGQTVRDLSGHGNDLTTLVTVPGSSSSALTWSNDYHPDQPGHASLYFNGSDNPLTGAYLITGAKAPLNSETFTRGFTIETFVKVPLDFDPDTNAFAAVLSRYGASGQAGKTGGDPQEPIFALTLSGGREPQVVAYSPNQNGSTTNWGHSLPEDQWWHLAVVNDGRRTILYVEGCPTVDNPHMISRGLVQLGLPWALGGSQYNGSDNTIFHGFVGDVRIVNRPLPVEQFMIGR
jgi:Concanavalin A-like lectin/glucanases superfamily/Calcineurin-like phosphoesterase